MKIGELSRVVSGAACEMSAQLPVIIGWAYDTSDGLRQEWGVRVVIQAAIGIMDLPAGSLR